MPPSTPGPCATCSRVTWTPAARPCWLRASTTSRRTWPSRRAASGASPTRCARLGPRSPSWPARSGSRAVGGWPSSRLTSTCIRRSRDTKQRDAEQHAALCRTLDLDPPDSPAGLARILASLADLDARARDDRAAIDNAQTEAAVARRELDGRAVQLRAELAGLSTRDTNIDERMIAVREQLCAAVGLSPGDVPFVGELLRVTDPEWEPAAERLLHGFGLSLLVADRHYGAVSEWVDRTNLRGRLRLLPGAWRGAHARARRRTLAGVQARGAALARVQPLGCRRGQPALRPGVRRHPAGVPGVGQRPDHAGPGQERRAAPREGRSPPAR